MEVYTYILSIICKKFQKEGFVVKEAESADYLIIETALKMEKILYNMMWLLVKILISW